MCYNEGMKKLTKEWEVLKSFLPEGWEEQARESKAIRRTRKVSSAEELLRVELLHFGEGLSLKEASAAAKEGGISDISGVALYYRTRKSAEWLRWMSEGILERLGTQIKRPEWLEGYRVRAIDGSHISEQGSTGSDWILHYSWELFGLRNDYFEITPSSQGESATRFPVQKGDIILADRHYGKAKTFDYISNTGGYFVTRLKHKAAKYFNKDGEKVDLLTLLRPLVAGQVLDTVLYYRSERKVDAPLKPLRICAIRKSKEYAERAKRKTLRQIKKHPHKKPTDSSTLEMSEYFVLGTSLSADNFSASCVLELYRLRWQVELAFKRLKSLMQLGQLPKHDQESCRAWLYGKMLYALLCYAIVDRGRLFSPWGYPLKIS